LQYGRGLARAGPSWSSAFPDLATRILAARASAMMARSPFRQESIR
jgi:hypothetical protein